LNFPGAADFFKAGEVPFPGKIDALLRLDRLNGAAARLEKDAFAAGLVDQGKPLAVGLEAGEALDKIPLGQALERGDGRDFGFIQFHLARPPAAGAATPAGALARDVAGANITGTEQVQRHAPRHTPCQDDPRRNGWFFVNQDVTLRV